MPADSTTKDLDQLLRQARGARARYEPIWFMNLSFYEGFQWLAWDGRQLYRPAMPRSKITIVDNRIQPCVRTEIARMTKNRPVFTVTPSTADEEDTNASELGEQIMRYLWRHLHMHDLTIKGLQWSRICGAGFLKCYWDSSIGEKRDVLLGPDGKVLTGAEGRPVKPNSPEHQLAESIRPGAVKAKTVAQGDIRVEVRSPFQMFVDPLADTFDEAEWVIEESVKSVEYVKRRYGKELQADTVANPGLVEARMGSAYLPGSGGYKGIKVREYWAKPSSVHPNGRRAVWATSGGAKNPVNTMLEEDDRPFDPMPYVMLSGIPVPGRLWPTSIVEQLRGPQTELNKVKSQIAENRNRVGNPTILASKQAVQDTEKFAASTSMPGGIYFFDDIGSPNTVPKYLEAPPLPPYVVEEIQRIEESIQEISGQHEVTSAQVPPGVTAASAINLLQEADNTRLGPAMTDYEDKLGVLGQKLLKLVGKYYTDARTIRIGGDNGAWQIFDFRGAMLRNNTHVEVQAGSAFPHSQAAKQAQIQDLMTFFVQSGNPPHGRQLAQFLQDSQIGGAERLVQQYTVNETQCNRENVMLSEGTGLAINSFDDDEAHIANHTDFQRQPRYSQLPDQIKHLFEVHVGAHRERLQMQQQAQMQAQLQASGQPPPEQAQAQAQMEMQGQQQEQGLQAAQQGQQMNQQAAQHAQQQGFSQAEQEQKQRQAEAEHQASQLSVAQRQRMEMEQHQQRIQQAEQEHQQKLHHAEESHRARLSAQAEQARRPQGAAKNDR